MVQYQSLRDTPRDPYHRKLQLPGNKGSDCHANSHEVIACQTPVEFDIDLDTVYGDIFGKPSTALDTQTCQFTQKQIEDIKTSSDIALNDLSILSPAKKHLIEKYTPLAIVQMLKQKHQMEIDIQLSDEQQETQEKSPTGKHSSKKGGKPSHNRQVAWKSKIWIESYPGGKYQAEAVEMSKQRSRQVAAIKWLCQVFPSSYTWNLVQKQVMHKKKPLEGLLVDLYQVKHLQQLTAKEEQENDTRRLVMLIDLIKKQSQQPSRMSIEDFLTQLQSMIQMLSEELLDSPLDKQKHGQSNDIERNVLELTQTIQCVSEQNLQMPTQRAVSINTSSSLRQILTNFTAAMETQMVYEQLQKQQAILRTAQELQYERELAQLQQYNALLPSQLSQQNYMLQMQLDALTQGSENVSGPAVIPPYSQKPVIQPYSQHLGQSGFPMQTSQQDILLQVLQKLKQQ